MKFVYVLILLFFSTTHGMSRAERSDRDKAINIESDRVTVDDAKEISVFDGNVVLTQGTLTIRGERLEVRRDKEGFSHGTVWGKRALFRQKRDGVNEWVEGTAERVEYDSRADKVQFFTRALLKRGADEVSGDYISYDANTEFFQVIGGCAKAANGNKPDGRVRTVMTPRGKAPAPASTPPAAAVPPGKPVPLRQADGIAAPRDDPGTPR